MPMISTNGLRQKSWHYLISKDIYKNLYKKVVGINKINMCFKYNRSTKNVYT